MGSVMGRARVRVRMRVMGRGTGGGRVGEEGRARGARKDKIRKIVHIKHPWGHLAQPQPPDQDRQDGSAARLSLD